MIRQTAIDMENSRNLLSEYTETHVYQGQQKYLVITCCMVLSYSAFFTLGFFSGYNNGCDGSTLF